MSKPRVVYKYENFSAQSLRNLKAQAVYFGSPLGFNDPYDCALKPQIISPTDAELDILRSEYSSRPDVPEHIREEFSRTEIDKLRQLVISNATAVVDKHVRSFLQTKGVTCFSERNNDLLMWSHYGGRYKGFCLEPVHDLLSKSARKAR